MCGLFTGLVLSRLAKGPLLAVLPRPGTGVVATQVWLGAGSALDPPGRGGSAHFLEHMMFKGTKRRPPEAIVAFVEGRGGHLNAHTGLESTAYEAVLPGDGWSRLLAYEADRFTAPAYAEFAAERQVILEERRMAVAASPRSRLWEGFAGRLFPGHSYGRPVLGSGEEIAAITPAGLRAFFARHYRPQAAVVVLVGDL
ncbi:insulinase family protein, partial [bacterium]|nr:insulinase family protein [bacterium]